VADSITPLTQSSPGAAASVSPSNPFSVTFWANEAALTFSTERSLAEDQEATRETNSTYNYNRGVNQRAEPLKLTANRNSANSNGLAESGVLAKTQSVAQTDFAQKDQRLGETRRNAVEKYQGKENDAVTQYGLDTAKYVADAQTEGLKALEENPPAPALGVAPTNPATAVNPGGVKTVRGPAGPGGVVPYSESSKAGSVRVGPATAGPPRVVGVKPQPVSTVRKAAAKKVVQVG
jgi:hypothetical protein